MDSSFKKIFKASGAASFAQLINVVNQLILVPVYMKFWGPNLFGEWLILSAAPSIIAMAGDLGFGTVAANEMNLCVAKNNRPEALKVFQNTWIVISTFSLLSFAIAFGFITYFQVDTILNIKSITEGDTKIILLVFLACILLSQQSILLGAGLRCEGHYVIGMTVYNVVKVSELSLIVIFVVFYEAKPLEVAFISLSMVITSIILGKVLVAKRSPWIKYGISHFSFAIIKKQLPIAFSFLSFPITQAFSIQGVVIIVGAILGPTTVVIFATTRTFMNVIKQVVSVMSTSTWPELTTAYGQENLDKFRKIFITSLQVLILILVAFNGFVLLIGKPLYLFWTKNKIEVNNTFFYTFAIITSVSAVWNLFGIVQEATNRVKKYALYNLISIIILISLVFVLCRTMGINGILVAIALSETFMLIFIVREAFNVLQYKSVNDFSKQLFAFRLKDFKYFK